MTRRGLGPAVLVMAGVALALAAREAAAQAPLNAGQKWTLPRTPEGHPDLQGAVWTTGPDAVLYTGDLETGVADESARTIQGQDVYPGSSLVIDPPSGLIPYKPWAAARRESLPHQRPAPLIGRKVADHEPRTLREIRPQTMCLPAAPRIVFDRDFQVIQTPGYVVMLWEWSHAYRVIHLDGRPPLPAAVKMAMGVSRGRWEHDTLVVETTNLNDWDWIDASGAFFTDAMTAVERYTLIDANTIHYEVTITDPNVYTQPWTVSFPIRARRDKEQLHWFGQLEVACVEGERAVGHILHDDPRKFPDPY